MRVMAPQPLLTAIAEVGRSEVLLLLAVTDSDPIPAKVKAIGVAADPFVMV